MRLAAVRLSCTYITDRWECAASTSSSSVKLGVSLCREFTMLDLNSMAEFSRCHCIGICALLVPVNLILSTTTILLVGANRSARLIYAMAAISVWPAIALFLHVATWWSIGVVMLPTFILPVLATICLATHAYAVINPHQMRVLLWKILALPIAKYWQLATSRSSLIDH
jgi:hypothetical protein